MKKYKYILCILVLVIFMTVLSGCHGEYPIEITVKSENMSDNTIDILLQLDNDDQNLYDTEIANYSIDGYRSMITHYRLSDYEIEKNDDSTYTVRLYLNGKWEFKNLCSNYETFKIAVVDTNGKVLQVSDECNFRLSEKVYIDKIEYDYNTNTVNTEYKYERDLTVIFLEFFSELAIPVMPILAVLYFVFFIIKVKGIPQVYQIIIFMIFTVPVIAFFGFRIDYALKTGNTLLSAWNDFLNLGANITAIYHLIPIIILLIVIIWSFVKVIHYNNDNENEL